MSDQYSITVTIEQKTLDVLKKDPEIVLVLVKDVKSQGDLKNGNVVFATYGSQDLSPKQSFTWEESYAVSETTQGFESGVKVESGTLTGSILRGQTATIESDGAVDVKGQSDPTGNITVLNLWKNAAHLILSCTSVVNGKDVTVPHYISAERVIGETSVLTPVISFSVLFVSNTKTETMIDVTQTLSGHFEINKGHNDCTVRFDTYVKSVKDQWTAIKNATKLN